MNVNAGQYSLYTMKYPDPFLDQASVNLPKNEQKMWEMLYLFGLSNSTIRPIIHRIAKYPITHIIVKTKDNIQSVEQRWKKILERYINVYDLAVEMGLDYMGYGVCYVYMHRPFVRTYACGLCKKEIMADELKFYINNKSIVGKCPECNKSSKFEANDNYYDSTEKIKFMRVPPNQMFVKYNECTGDCKFLRSVPIGLKNAISNKAKPDYFIINTTPWKYVQAALENKKIEYSENRILHLRSPTMSGPRQHLGEPISIAALKDAYQNQILKKADETVANERAVPARFIYPQQTGSRDPKEVINLSRWSKYMQQVLQLRRFDHNAVMPVPFPVGVAEIGGDMQRLTNVHLRQMVISEIQDSTGLPRSFLSGEMTYSGGVHMTRMVENMIGPYLRAQQRLLRFVAKEISRVTDMEEPEDIKWKEFKKADDMSTIQMLMSLMQTGDVSASEVLDRFDLDWEEQSDKSLQEVKKRREYNVQNGLTEVQTMLASVDMQAASQQRQQSSSQILGEAQQTDEQFKADLSNPMNHVRDMADHYMVLPEEEQDPYLESIYDQSPELYRAVSQEIEKRSVRTQSKSPKELATSIMMMENSQSRHQMIEEINKSHPQLGALVMSEIKNMFSQTGLSGRTGLKSTNFKINPDQKPPKGQ